MMSAKLLLRRTSMSSAISAVRTSRCCSCRAATSRTSACPTRAAPATACCCRRWPTQFGVPVASTPSTPSKRKPVAQVQLRLRGVPRLRPGQLPEGGLRRRRAARRSSAGAAKEYLAVRGADSAHGRARPPLRATGRHPEQHGCAQGAGRLHRRARSRTPRCTSTRIPARPGHIGAAFEALRVVKRNAVTRPLSVSIRPRSTSTYTTRPTMRLRAATSARTTARAPSSTPRPRWTATPRATSQGSRARRAPSRTIDALKALNKRPRKKRR